MTHILQKSWDDLPDGAEQRPCLLRQCVHILAGGGAPGQLLLHLTQPVVEDGNLAVIVREARLGHGSIVLPHGFQRSVKLPVALRRFGEPVVIFDVVKGADSHRHIAGLRHEIQISLWFGQPADKERRRLRLLVGGPAGAKTNPGLRFWA